MLVAAAIFAFGSCKNDKRSQQDDFDDEDNIEMADEDEEDEDAADDALPKRSDYKFRTEVVMSEPDEEGDEVVENIIIHMKPRHGKETIVDIEAAMPLDTINWHGFGVIHEDDINFDGYPDLMVCGGPSNAYGNYTYDAWLWNQQTHSFDHVDGFYEIFDPVIDADRKEITGGFHMNNEYEYQEVWKWKGNKIVMIESKTIDYTKMDDEEEDE